MKNFLLGAIVNNCAWLLALSLTLWKEKAKKVLEVIGIGAGILSMLFFIVLWLLLLFGYHYQNENTNICAQVQCKTLENVNLKGGEKI